jgi:hypothetical protein
MHDIDVHVHTQASSAEPPEAAMHTLLLSTLSLFSNNSSGSTANISSYAPLLPLLRLVDAAAYAEAAARRNSPVPARRADVFSDVAGDSTVQLLRLLLQLAQPVQHTEAVLVIATLLRDDGAAVGTLRTCPSNVQVPLCSLCCTTACGVL